MARFVRLSYEIRFEHPGWPGNPTYDVRAAQLVIERGDVANFGMLHLLGHFGSHLDAPKHFNPDGHQGRHVPLDRFVYERPVLVDAPKQDRELVSREDLEPHDERLRHADIVLIRTGWCDVRDPDPVRYAAEGPGVSPEACDVPVGAPGAEGGRARLHLARGLSKDRP